MTGDSFIYGRDSGLTTPPRCPILLLTATHRASDMNSQPKQLQRSPMLQQIRDQLRAQLRHPVLATSPVVKEIKAKQEPQNG